MTGFIPGCSLNDVDRIVTHNYNPSDDDIMHAYKTTTGIREYRFDFDPQAADGRELKVYDTDERISASLLSPIFNDMDAIIFLAPVSCFDEVLPGNPDINRLSDSVNRWVKLCSYPLPSRVTLIIFFNKLDILRQKIEYGTKFATYVRSYGDRSNDVKTVCQYVKEKFRKIQKHHSRQPRRYYAYFTSVVTDMEASSMALGIVNRALIDYHLDQTDII